MKASETTIILFSTADWSEPYWTNKQHMAQTLTSLGYSVVYVESVGIRSPKLNSSKDIKRIVNRVVSGLKTVFFGGKREKGNFAVLSPLVIPNPNNHQFLSKVNNTLLSFLVNREVKAFKLPNIITWTYHPYILDLLETFDSQKVIYHCVDDLSQIPGIDELSFKQQEERFLPVCDTVFVTTRALEERCSVYNNSVHYHGNVVDFNHFAYPKKISNPMLESISSNSKRKVVYHGVLSDFKVDFSLFYDIALNAPEYDFYIIGQEREGQRNRTLQSIASLSNVHHIGYVSYEELPSFLSHMDVALLPSQINEYTHSMFPMKFYEYVAARLPVISTPLGFTEYTKNEALSVASTASDFTILIEQHIKNGKLDQVVSESIVGENTWLGRTNKMLSVLREE
ncbi:glycosyltransferase [Vibrio tubiashii]|uniref:glycosyltransferase n=1 Tax=Vibrio tubiashii TaxID=29498 RepID=UPI00234F6578|nr:glycosyltransferase [Vibrio tubiashii]WCP67276.1 glycosyltransferase [Vibrio tubiashii]